MQKANEPYGGRSEKIANKEFERALIGVFAPDFALAFAPAIILFFYLILFGCAILRRSVFKLIYFRRVNGRKMPPPRVLCIHTLFCSFALTFHYVCAYAFVSKTVL
jgi:hypothetical protein